MPSIVQAINFFATSKVNEAKSGRLRTRLQAEYQSKDKEVKRSVGKDKKEWVDHIARGAGEAASH